MDTVIFLISQPATLAVLLVAIWLDRLLGEPKRFHPLIAFGHWASFCEQHFNINIDAFKTRLLGVFTLLLVLSPLLLIGWGLAQLHEYSLWLWLAAQALILYSCIGWTSLQQHVGVVEQALQQGDLDEARLKLSWIVSRDTSELSADEIAQACAESLLENSLDSLFASIFWFLIGGALLALLHRWSNTLDAMWGYKNTRFYYFGWAAARLDDVLAYIPARILAFTFVLVGQHKRQALNCWLQQAKHCASPNGGPVMTSGAGSLNIILSMRARYHGEWKAKPIMGAGSATAVNDLPNIVTLIKHSLMAWLLLVSVLTLFFLFNLYR